MEQLAREPARVRWQEFWHGMHKEWFKIEVLQDYSGEDDCESLQAWLLGDKTRSLDLMRTMPQRAAWEAQCQQKCAEGVQMRRVRIIQRPLTPYTAWELEFYRRANIPGGEEILVVDHDDIAHLHHWLPAGDVMLFDGERAGQCDYDSSGRMTSETFYDLANDAGVMAGFLQLQADLLAVARPLSS
jgi:hypothetical protein